MNDETSAPDKKGGESAKAPLKQVDWGDFRDHIATAERSGKRRWLYPRKVAGKYYNYRTWFSWLLICIMFAGPFITIHGNPLLLMNLVERKFVVLGQIFWPQDMVIFAVTVLILFVGIFVFTAAFGRVWCGWACPQTVMMEMVFRKLEYAIEGDAAAQKLLNAAPWDARKIRIKALKHTVFFALSFLVGNVLLSYIIGWQQLYQIITDPPAQHLVGLSFMLAFALLFYGIFARFREQACTFVCPYGRYQSVLLDVNSIVVAYDFKRGEKRGPLKRNQPREARLAAGVGDCVNCNHCVAVCPTGIDIRNGTQMECIHCTACMDACDTVMTKVGSPKGLIRYASQNGIEKGERLKVTPRLIGYSVIILALTGLLATLLITRSDVEATLLRAPGSLFQTMPDGRIANLYTIRIVNKTSQAIPVELKLEQPSGEVQVMAGGQLAVAPQKTFEDSVLIELDKGALQGGTTRLILGVYSHGKKIQTIKSAFVGPGN